MQVSDGSQWMGRKIMWEQDFPKNVFIQYIHGVMTFGGHFSGLCFFKSLSQNCDVEEGSPSGIGWLLPPNKSYSLWLTTLTNQITEWLPERYWLDRLASWSAQCTAEGRSNTCTTHQVPRICEQNKSLSEREKVFPTSFIAHIFLNGTLTFQNDQKDKAECIFLKEIFLRHAL